MGVYIVLWDPSSGGELRESLLKEVIPTQISVVCSQEWSESKPARKDYPPKVKAFWKKIHPSKKKKKAKASQVRGG